MIILIFLIVFIFYVILVILIVDFCEKRKEKKRIKDRKLMYENMYKYYRQNPTKKSSFKMGNNPY
jgi:preprotein translocase subunit YajC